MPLQFPPSIILPDLWGSNLHSLTNKLYTSKRRLGKHKCGGRTRGSQPVVRLFLILPLPPCPVADPEPCAQTLVLSGISHQSQMSLEISILLLCRYASREYGINERLSCYSLETVEYRGVPTPESEPRHCTPKYLTCSSRALPKVQSNLILSYANKRRLVLMKCPRVVRWVKPLLLLNFTRTLSPIVRNLQPGCL